MATPSTQPRTPHAPHAPHDHAARPADRWRRPLAALLAAGGVSLLGTGAFASWQATASATSASLDAATGSLTLDASGGRLSVGVANLLPGDWLHRYASVTNTGSVTAVTTQTASATGALAAGLKVTADSCSVAWNTTTHTCSGTTTALGSGTLGTAVPFTPSSIASGGVQFVRYRIEVLPDASSTLMGTSGVVTISAVSDLVGGRDRSSS